MAGRDITRSGHPRVAPGLAPGGGTESQRPTTARCPTGVTQPNTQPRSPLRPWVSPTRPWGHLEVLKEAPGEDMAADAGDPVQCGMGLAPRLLALGVPELRQALGEGPAGGDSGDVRVSRGPLGMRGRGAASPERGAAVGQGDGTAGGAVGRRNFAGGFQEPLDLPLETGDTPRSPRWQPGDRRCRGRGSCAHLCVPVSPCPSPVPLCPHVPSPPVPVLCHILVSPCPCRVPACPTCAGRPPARPAGCGPSPARTRG